MWIPDRMPELCQTFRQLDQIRLLSRQTVSSVIVASTP